MSGQHREEPGTALPSTEEQLADYIYSVQNYSDAKEVAAHLWSMLAAAQGVSSCGELFSLIDTRLADLREANDIFRKMSWDRSSDIQRNDREIRWLIDFRTLLPASPPSPVAGEWQPIETAPRDGRWIVAICNDGTQVLHVYWQADQEAWYGHRGAYGDGLFSPHGGWIPAPAPRSLTIPSTTRETPINIGAYIDEHGDDGR